MPKFLIIRFSSIGDIVLTTPVVRAIKNRFPNSEVHFVTKRAFVDLVRHNPYIDKVFQLDESLSHLANALRSEKYTHIIDLHHNLRTTILKLKLIGVKSFTFSKLNFRKWIYIRTKWQVMPAVHIVDRYLKSVDSLDVHNDGLGLDFFLPPDLKSPFDVMPTIFHNGYIAIVVGAKHFTKRIPQHRIVELCSSIKTPIVLLGGPEDETLGNAVALESGPHVISACGKLSLMESAAAIKDARLVITSDTGLMHIAAAYKRNVISLWGNTTPELGMYPYRSGDRSQIFEVSGLSCRPCSKIGYDKCPKGHFRCMENIDYSAIIDLVHKLTN
ncbi:MAG TPA: glycosyltransferase family 9 protein [Williamwhitmania sp.]|nr:glycosyltransferase family 9 protein [Williamwhitmania sp.]